MSRPISKSLLIHSCVFSRPQGYDPDGEPTGWQETELQHVRIAPDKSTVLTATGYTQVDTLTVFIDCVNSEPADFVPLERDRVLWNGELYTAKTVKACYTRGTDAVHHYEVGLV